MDGPYPALGWTNGSGYPGYGPQTEGDVVQRHGSNDTTNVLWCDGHAKTTRLTQLMSKNSAGYMWQFTMEANPN